MSQRVRIVGDPRLGVYFALMPDGTPIPEVLSITVNPLRPHGLLTASIEVNVDAVAFGPGVELPRRQAGPKAGKAEQPR